MKALLVADDEKAINNISEVLKSAGYDTIVYKWFLKALDNIEEIAPKHTFYSYDAKYNDPNGADLLIPASVDQETIENIRTLAKRAYTAVDAAGLSRVDFFLDKDTNALYLNEINTMPGFTQISMFPKLCQAAGTSYMELMDILLEEAVSRAKAKAQLKTSR